MHTILNGKNDNWNYIGKWWLPSLRVPVIYLLVLLGLNFKPINITSISENWICNLTLKTLNKLPFSSLCPYVWVDPYSGEGIGIGKGKGREREGRVWDGYD
jgi:hypothetical protein